jgi:hypothetical protein
MHNRDEVFQYFAVDFRSSDLAVHGSNALTKAVFVNDAIKTILALYKDSTSPTAQKRIIVVGHSVGGMIARTAVTLSNHPRCAVSDIVLLSTPTRRASFSPDASMEALYKHVNRAWTQSYFNSSPSCVRARGLEADADAFGAGAEGEAVRGVWTCPACASGIRLVSVSGGVVDLLVPSGLTSLEGLAPRPRNLTAESLKSKGKGGGLSSLATSVLGFIPATQAWVTRQVYSLMSGGSNSTSVSGSNATVSAAPVGAPRERRNGTYGELFALSDEQWRADVMPYREAHLVSVRTSQLYEGGFPVDHNAILWCRQVVTALTRAMRRLAQAPRVNSTTDGHDTTIFRLFTHKSHPRDSPSVPPWLDPQLDDLIAPVAGYARRNESHHAWLQGEGAELEYLAKRLPGGALQAAALHFVCQHLIASVFSAYVLLALLALSVPLRRRLTAFSVAGKGGAAGQDWATLRWTAHFHLEEFAGLPALLSSWLGGGGGASAVLSPSSLLLSVAAKVVFDIWFSPSSALLGRISLYRSAFAALAGYALALLLRLVLLTLAYASRAVLGSAWSTVKAVVWTVQVRRSTKPFRRSMRAGLAAVGLGESVLSFLGDAALPVLVAGSVVGAAAWRSYDRIIGSGSGGVLSVSAFVTSLATLGLSASCVVLVLAALLLPGPGLHDHTSTSLALAYLPLLFLCYPSARFSFALLFDPVGSFAAAAQLFDIFGPERITTCLCLLGVTLHLALARRCGYDSLDHVSPLPWIAELRGSIPDHVAKALSFSVSASSSSSSSSTCVHEDGGKFALFEEVQEKEQAVAVSPGVVLGATYRVVACACHADKTLKFQSEWCEFCQCRKCGGKNLPRDDFGADGKGLSLEKLLEAPPDALLLVALILCAGAAWTYAYDVLHRHLLILGGVAGAFLARDASVAFYRRKQQP